MSRWNPTPILLLSTMLLLALLLAACDEGAVPVPTEASEPTATVAVATDIPVPTEAATETEAEREPEAAPAEVAAPEAQQVTFVLVPEETTAGYSIEEIFINDNNTLNTAIGTTSVVTGEFTLNYAEPTASSFGQFVVDISTLRSDQTRRDRAIRTRWLESASYPLATFDVTEVRNFPAEPAEGVPIEFQLVGDMTVKETTREVVWDVIAMLQGDRLTGTATLATMLENFNIPIPSILGVLRVTDGITLTLEFVFERAAE